MEKYYVIPVTSEIAQIDGVSFLDMLKNVDEELYNREIEKNQLETLGVKSDEVSRFNEETKRMYQEKHIPEKLCFVHTFDDIKELVSHKSLSGDFIYLDVFSMDRKTFDEKIIREKIYPFKENGNFFDVFDYSYTQNFIQRGLAAKEEVPIKK